MSTQSRKSFLTTSAVITAGLAANVLSAFSEPAKKGIIHHVFFWLKNPDSKEDLAKLLAGLE
ncbi:MAG: Dabb family protein, partial [Bacteroidota bacterium]|nr:Dabb family protein [Bacteroidota bacterium]